MYKYTMQHICFQNFRNYTNAAVYTDYKLSERDMISKQIICQGALKDTICKNTLYISLHLKFCIVTNYFVNWRM